MAKPVTVRILPDAKITKLGIIGVNHTIVVGVIGCEGLESVCSTISLIAEQFRIIINDAIIIEVDSQKPGSSPNPAGLFPKPIRVYIPINRVVTIDQ